MAEPMNCFAEQSVLGSMFQDSTIVPDVMHTVRDDDFLLETDREIFRAARALYAANRPVDATTVRDRLGASYSNYLLQLIETTPTSANWEEYAALMRDRATVHLIHERARELLEHEDLESCRTIAEDLRRASQGSQRFETYTAAQILESFIARQTTREEMNFVRYGIPSIDRCTHTRIGHMVVIAARPSDGKTALALQVAFEMSKTYRVGFFSLETNEEDIGDRMASHSFGLDLETILERQRTPKDWEAIAARSDDFSRRSFKLVRCSTASAEEIISASEANGFEIIFVDYLQLVRPSRTNSMRSEEVAQVSRELHAFAQRGRGTLVFALSQLSRLEKGSWRPPALSDLRESGQIEQDADAVMFIYRPPEGGKLDENSTRYIDMAKQKNGTRWRDMFHFDGAHQTFSALDTSHSDSAEIMRGFVDKGKKAKAARRANTPGQVKLEEIENDKEAPF